MDKILTLNSLYKFFTRFDVGCKFSSKDTGKPIVVSVPAQFDVQTQDAPGLLRLRLKVCHTELNRNGSYIARENMVKAMPSLKYRPILAYIHTLPNGDADFYAHNMEIVEADGEQKINYIEQQVGCFTADDPVLEYDDEMEKEYVIAYAVIPEDYTEAANIIRRKNGTKVSCELVINELAYNANEQYLELTDFYFSGTTLLGCDEDGEEIGEGMLGARADIADFLHKEPVFTYHDKLIEALDRLNVTLSNFNTQTTEEGGEDMTHFEELLAKYGKVAEDVTFEIEGLSDEELDAKFAELFGVETETEAEQEEEHFEDEEQPTADEEQAEVETMSDAAEEEEEVPTEEYAKRKHCSLNDNGMTVSFDISHEDIRYSLYQLLAGYEESDDEWYEVYQVFDDYFVMHCYNSNKFYTQAYTVSEDGAVAFSGDRTEVYQMLLTESEKQAVDNMRTAYEELQTKYNELKAFKDEIDAKQLQAQKDAIFARAEYGVVAESDEFKSLVQNAAKYSVEECEVKADVMLAKYYKTFARTASESTVVVVAAPKESKKTSPYGNLFN